MGSGSCALAVPQPTAHTALPWQARDGEAKPSLGLAVVVKRDAIHGQKPGNSTFSPCVNRDMEQTLFPIQVSSDITVNQQCPGISSLGCCLQVLSGTKSLFVMFASFFS